MVSVTKDNILQFKNVGGYLSFKFYGDGISVKSITLKGNNHEKLAGAAKVTMPLDGMPVVTMQSTATEEITLVCDEPVVLGVDGEHYTEFWFVLPPTEFRKGFTVTVMDSRGCIFTTSTSSAVSITRNTLSRMAPMEVGPSMWEAVLTGVYSVLGAVAAKDSPVGADVFGYSEFTTTLYEDVKHPGTFKLSPFGDTELMLNWDSATSTYFVPNQIVGSYDGTVVNVADRDTDQDTDHGYRGEWDEGILFIYMIYRLGGPRGTPENQGILNYGYDMFTPNE